MRAAFMSLALFCAAPSLAFAQSLGDTTADEEAAAEAAEEELEAAEGHHGHLSLKEILDVDLEDKDDHSTELWAAVINFTLLVLILIRSAKKPVSEFLQGRRREIELKINEAAEMKAKAEAKFKEYNDRIAQLDDELKQLRADIERGAQEDKQRIVAEAQQSAQNAKRETEALIDQHSKALQNAVRGELVEAALARAEGLLKQSVTDSDQQRLADSYKQRVAESPRGGAS